MSVSNLPLGLLPLLPLKCALCNNTLPLEQASVGMLDEAGNQTFSCVSHLSEIEKLINGWADFIAEINHKRFVEASNGYARFNY